MDPSPFFLVYPFMPSSQFYPSSFLSTLVLASVLALPGKAQFTNPVFALAKSLGEYWFFHGPMGWYLVGGACRTKVHKFGSMEEYYEFYKDESCQPVAPVVLCNLLVGHILCLLCLVVGF